jgi:hypothetical protein
MSEPETPNQRLATILLGMPVQEWIIDQRDMGRSWRDIAQRLNHATRGQVDISYEAVRQWAEQAAA